VKKSLIIMLIFTAVSFLYSQNRIPVGYVNYSPKEVATDIYLSDMENTYVQDIFKLMKSDDFTFLLRKNKYNWIGLFKEKNINYLQIHSSDKKFNFQGRIAKTGKITVIKGVKYKGLKSYQNAVQSAREAKNYVNKVINSKIVFDGTNEKTILPEKNIKTVPKKADSSSDTKKIEIKKTNSEQKKTDTQKLAEPEKTTGVKKNENSQKPVEEVKKTETVKVSETKTGETAKQEKDTKEEAVTVEIKTEETSKPADLKNEETAAAETKKDFVEGSSEANLQKLIDGNKRYIENKSKYPNQTLERRLEVAKTQHPFAIIVGCSDSRVPPEIIFDQGIGDLFVVRSSGEVVMEAEMGSIEYAVENLDVNLIIVLGHKNCDIVETALKGGEFTGKMAYIADLINVTAETSRKKAGDLLDNTIKDHAKNMTEIIKLSKIIEEKTKIGKVKIFTGYYDLDTGAVNIY
jgi:carbonic anhydrase